MNKLQKMNLEFLSHCDRMRKFDAAQKLDLPLSLDIKLRDDIIAMVDKHHARVECLPAEIILRLDMPHKEAE